MASQVFGNEYGLSRYLPSLTRPPQEREGVATPARDPRYFRRELDQRDFTDADVVEINGEASYQAVSFNQVYEQVLSTEAGDQGRFYNGYARAFAVSEYQAVGDSFSLASSRGELLNVLA